MNQKNIIIGIIYQSIFHCMLVFVFFQVSSTVYAQEITHQYDFPNNLFNEPEEIIRDGEDLYVII